MLYRRDQLLESIAGATKVLLALDNLAESIAAALTIALEGAGCDRISILENNFDSSSILYEQFRPGFIQQLSQTEERTRSQEIRAAFLEQYFLKGDGFGELLVDWNERSSVQSTYAVPIQLKDQWWGLFCFEYCQEVVRLSAAEVAVLKMLADCMGSAIQRDRRQTHLLQVEQARAAELAKANDALKQTVDLLANEPDLDRFLGHVLKGLAEQFGAPLIQYWEHPEPGDIAYLRLACSHGKILTVADLPQDCLVTGIQIPPELVGHENIHTRKRHYVVEDVPTDPIQQAIFSPLNFDLETWCTEWGIRKLINIPLMQAEKTTGSLLLYFASGHNLSEQQIEMMYVLAQQVTLAIQLTQLTEIKQTEAIARAQESAAQERVTELLKANTALKQSLDALAKDPDLDRFIGHTMELIAQQLDAPRIEYWVHSKPENQAYSYLTYWQGNIFKSSDPAAQVGLDVMPFLGILLSVGDRHIGGLEIYLTRPRIFAGQTLELVHTLAQQLTLAIELTRLAEESQQAALLQERARMAREIHDTLAQAFGGISMQLQAVNYFFTSQPEQAQTHLSTAQTLALEGLAEARRSVWTLYLETTEYEDPSQTIAKFIEQSTAGQPVPIHLAIVGSPYRLHPDLGLNLLRIAQESITNALRHAQPQTLQIHLIYSLQTLQLMIRDDGCGFEPQLPTRGFGLSGMQQRAARIGATWHLVSRPGEGTTITVTLTHPASP
jgi:signal transduction histidine kinase